MMTQAQTRTQKAENPMASTWTKAAKVRRAFKAGRQRQKDLVLAPIKAMFEGCILLHGLQSAMKEAGLAENDVQAALVLMTPETSNPVDWIWVLPIPETQNLPKLYGKVKQLDAEGALPLGIVIKQLDHEAYDPKDPKSGAVAWAQPWLTSPRAALALIKARQAFAEGEKDKIRVN